MKLRLFGGVLLSVTSMLLGLLAPMGTTAPNPGYAHRVVINGQTFWTNDNGATVTGAVPADAAGDSSLARMAYRLAQIPKRTPPARNLRLKQCGTTRHSPLLNSRPMVCRLKWLGNPGPSGSKSFVAPRREHALLLLSIKMGSQQETRPRRIR